jgi:sec-independent protein translocase protein TatA
MPNIGPLEIIILLVIVLVIFGPKRLPELGKGLGKGMREFKDSVTGKDDDDKPELRASNTVQTTGQAPAPPDQAAAAQQQPPPAPATAPAPPPEAEQAAEPEAARSGESRG